MTAEGNNAKDTVPGPGDGTGIARRRLLRGALSAAPVVLTAASRPVLAATCTAASFVSLNASRPDQQTTCLGRSPGFWKNPKRFQNWTAPYVAEGPQATRFDDVFGAWSGYAGKTLLDVLGQGGGGRNSLARHIVASLLNAAAALTPPGVLSVTTVKTIWADFVTNGYYEPTAGVKWYVNRSEPPGAGDGIVPWLKTTMD